MTAYVVLIGSAYHVKSAHEYLETAMQEAIATGVRSFGCIVRDGKTAKRYSLDECREYLQKRQPNHSNRKRRNRS